MCKFSWKAIVRQIRLPTQGGKFLRSSDRSIEIMSAPHSHGDDSEPPPTISISPGALGVNRSNVGSPILSNRDGFPPLSTPASAPPSFGASVRGDWARLPYVVGG